MLIIVHRGAQQRSLWKLIDEAPEPRLEPPLHLRALRGLCGEYVTAIPGRTHWWPLIINECSFIFNPMSPRPRLASDAEIIEAAKRVISREGPNGFTLAEVGHEAGIAPSTLVQRFGSKRELMLAVAARAVAAEAPESCFAAARRETSSPLEALTRGLEDLAKMAPTPEELSNHLAFLQIDLTDPDFHELALANARLNRTGIAELLDEAIAADELLECDIDRLSVAVDAIAGGALINWAIHREGTARDAIRDALETLLGPYRAVGV